MSTLAHDLHLLVKALDRSAEVRLAPFGLTYARYLALLVVGDAPGLTQRDLAARLGLSEASASRTTTGLGEHGWIDIARTPGSGNRRTLALTEAGRALLDRAGTSLGRDFDDAVRAIGRSPEALARDVRRLTALLEESP
ncbi:MarR family winged helix-turn-helix transcriptional regulator [Janibacter terrae]|uniref:MarR family winged helix-turn-helix transcriptional regulator n=1 Tax=Janibacter terrae TaxID=103817 RepID=UPI000837816F|nr:MarR family transcriptional regulator [Janibacter terrae]